MSKVANKFVTLLNGDQTKINKVIAVATALRINPNWLLAVMYKESRLNPAAVNSIGSTGLIQFTRDRSGVNYKTIGGVQYTLSAIGAMDFVTQMDLVQRYYREAIGTKVINDFTDLYMATFFPVAVGKPDNYVLQTSGLSASLIASQNPIFDKFPQDGKLTKGEVTQVMKKMYTDLGFDFDTDINQTTAKAGFGILAGIALFFYTCVTVAHVIN